MGNREGGEWRGIAVLFFLLLLLFFFVLAAVSTRAWESNHNIVHSMYKDSQVQDKHKQNSNKGKADV